MNQTDENRVSLKNSPPVDHLLLLPSKSPFSILAHLDFYCNDVDDDEDDDHDHDGDGGGDGDDEDGGGGDDYKLLSTT